MRFFFAVFVASIISGCLPYQYLSLRPRVLSNEQRLEQFPKEIRGLKAQAQVVWTADMVPSILAANSSDMFLLLGLVHGHLRMGQISMLRLIARGQVSSELGPVAKPVDQAAALFDFSEVGRAQFQKLPTETKHFVERFAEGLELSRLHYLSMESEQRPVEWGLFREGADDRPFVPEDVIALGKLMSFDFSWVALYQRLSLQNTNENLREWLGSVEQSAKTAFVSPALNPYLNFLNSVARTGSNSMAYNQNSGALKPIIANDPHLGIFLPNIWVLVGMHSPDFSVVGYMLPGLPFVGVGRNPKVGWGGTNMRAISSYLVEVEESDITSTKSVQIETRSWFDHEFTVRRTEYGPVVSDHPSLSSFFRPGQMVALNWRGFRDSDELTSFFQAMRSKSAKDFSESFSSYAVSAQNYLAVDDAGGIFQVFGYSRPVVGNFDFAKTIYQKKDVSGMKDISPDQHGSLDWTKRGYVISANDQPKDDEEAKNWSYSFAPKDRFQRIFDLTVGKEITPDLLRQVQQDVFSQSSLNTVKSLNSNLGARLRDQLQSGLKKNMEVMISPLVVADLFLSFDGHYTVDSKSAYVFEKTLAHLARAFATRTLGEKALKDLKGKPQIFRKDEFVKALIQKDLLTETGREFLVESIGEAWMEISKKELKRFGEYHTLKLGHPFQNLPLVGKRFQHRELEFPGGNETVMKAAFQAGAESGPVTYGAVSRHISLMSDPDHNEFIMLGGNDGWVGSSALSSQVDRWLSGKTIHLPLTKNRVLDRSGLVRMRLTPLP